MHAFGPVKRVAERLNKAAPLLSVWSCLLGVGESFFNSNTGVVAAKL